MAFSGFGDDAAPTTLPGGASSTKSVPPDIFLIAQLNRFKGTTVPSGQQIGETPFDPGAGITPAVAEDALTVVGRRLVSSLATIQDEGAAQLLGQIRAVFGASDPTGGGLMVTFVQQHVVDMGNQVAAYADSLGLPPAKLPTVVLGLSGSRLMLAGAGLVGLLLLWKARKG